MVGARMGTTFCANAYLKVYRTRVAEAGGVLIS